MGCSGWMASCAALCSDVIGWLTGWVVWLALIELQSLLVELLVAGVVH